MPQNFIACDREQVLWLPPSLLDWVPPDHLVWTVLASVEEMDLALLYEEYRPDGHGRPAYDPKVMALLFYACAQRVRSSRAIERKCREDVAFMVITAMRVPDHSTIAEFRKRHERALAALFGDVLGMCAKAGLVKVGRAERCGGHLRSRSTEPVGALNDRMLAGTGSQCTTWETSTSTSMPSTLEVR